MRHRVRKNLKFNGKTFQHRKAMERNLLTNLFLHKSIKTTPKKASAIVPFVDKIINVVNTKDEMNAIRYVMQYIYTKESSLEIFKNIAPKFKGTRTSGFTRVTPIKYRDGDNAKLVLLELL
ncbi:MAG: 50S ribosomal protein L17 [Candidatus Gracilibacteria bacterium]|nr:50S ribosomal protein L17 [Candidatus Gracilibacteria bacterium]